MREDARREWPADVPRGTFHIEPTQLAGRPVTARILFVCPRGRRCGVFLGPRFDAKPREGEPNVWAWDGNAQRPTVTPSINCVTEYKGKPTSGCGWHGFITAGEMQ